MRPDLVRVVSAEPTTVFIQSPTVGFLSSPAWRCTLDCGHVRVFELPRPPLRAICRFCQEAP